MAASAVANAAVMAHRCYVMDRAERGPHPWLPQWWLPPDLARFYEAGREDARHGNPISTKTEATGGSAPRPTRTEVRRARRSWPATYKLQVLDELDGAPRGQVGVILRREGLYSSLISQWRQQRDAGALQGLADRRPGPAGADPVRTELDRLRADNAQLRQRVATQQELIGTQGKAFALLQQISPPSSANGSTDTPSR